MGVPHRGWGYLVGGVGVPHGGGGGVGVPHGGGGEGGYLIGVPNWGGGGGAGGTS